MKSKIVAAFSDHIKDLFHVVKEYEALNRAFDQDDRKKKVDYIDFKDYKPDWVFDKIDQHAAEIRLFYFSGHSSDDVLHFYRGGANREALATKLNILAEENKLQCVFLNGCSNFEIVKALYKVPIVIGTETPVQDDIASEFGKSFFTNLIDNENSFTASFTSALGTAQQKNTSIKGRVVNRKDLNPELYDDLNKWICVVKNNGLIGTLKFDLFRNRIKKWVLGIGLVLLLGILGLKAPGIIESFADLGDPGFSEAERCKILVEDFNELNGAVDTDFEEELVRGFNRNTSFENIIEAKYIPSLNDLIQNKDKGIIIADLPGLLGYNYNLSGSIAKLDQEAQYKIRFYTNQSKIFEGLQDYMIVTNPSVLNDLIWDFDFSQPDTLLIIKICTTCAWDNPSIIPSLIRPIDDISATSPENGQNLNFEVANASIHHQDTIQALIFLDRVSNDAMPDNVQAIAALEVSSHTREASGRNDAAFIDQTELVKRLESHSSNSSQIYGSTQAKRKEAYHYYRLRRANNVLNHYPTMGRKKILLANQIATAITDFKYLQEIRYDKKDYRPQILKLENLLKIDEDKDGFSVEEGDCDDNNRKVSPKAREICGNGIDDNCDGKIDEGCRIDRDKDGFTEKEGDCDDSNSKISPKSKEICGNKIDDDCDGKIDENCRIDNDGDGVTEKEGDCDDNNRYRSPNAREICGNGVDDDCDGEIDENCRIDRDKDGFTIEEGDCNDRNAKISPKAKEICGNGIDDDCDGKTDEDCRIDKDKDGFSEGEGDCDDGNAKVSPKAKEICGNGKDDDCDGKIDEGCPKRISQVIESIQTYIPKTSIIFGKIYKIAGQIYTCNKTPSTLSTFELGNKQVIVRNGNYQVQMRGSQGDTLMIKLPRGYSFSENRSSYIFLGKDLDIKESFQVNSTALIKATIRGSVYYNQQIKQGVSVIESGTTNVTNSLAKGQFQLELKRYNQCESKIEFKYKNLYKAIDLTKYPVIDGIIDIGRVTIR